MRLFSLVLILTTSTNFTTLSPTQHSSFSYVNSSATEQYTSTEIRQALHDRVFSISTDKTGTAWLGIHLPNGGKDLAGDDVTSNYTYYLFTNWHVVLDNPASVALKWSTNLDDDSSIDSPNVVTFNTNNGLAHWGWRKAEYYTFDNKMWFGADIAMTRVDFQNISSTDLLTRLDNLNNYANNHDGKLFNDYVNFNKTSLETEIYLGGYPSEDMFGTSHGTSKWENPHTQISEKCENFSRNAYDAKNKNKVHAIDEKDNEPEQEPTIFSIGDVYITTPQKSDEETNLYKLGRGASGSMAVDEHLNLVGIFWGVYELNNDANTLYPSLESFAWNGHNIITDFTENNLGNKEPEFMYYFRPIDPWLEIAFVTSSTIFLLLILGTNFKTNCKNRKISKA